MVTTVGVHELVNHFWNWVGFIIALVDERLTTYNVAQNNKVDIVFERNVVLFV